MLDIELFVSKRMEEQIKSHKMQAKTEVSIIRKLY